MHLLVMQATDEVERAPGAVTRHKVLDRTMHCLIPSLSSRFVHCKAVVFRLIVKKHAHQDITHGRCMRMQMLMA